MLHALAPPFRVKGRPVELDPVLIFGEKLLLEFLWMLLRVPYPLPPRRILDGANVLVIINFTLATKRVASGKQGHPPPAHNERGAVRRGLLFSFEWITPSSHADQVV